MWQLLAGESEFIADEFGDFSDTDVGSFAGVDDDWEQDSTGDDQRECRLLTALLASKPPRDLDHVRGAGQLWSPNQGECKGQEGAAVGQMAIIAAMIIMIVMYAARVARFYLLKSVCVLGKSNYTMGPQL